MTRFKLSDKFLINYEGKQPSWGFGDLSYLTFKRTYARLKPDGTQEEWFDTVKRVVEGCFNIQYSHCEKNGLHWDAYKAQKSAQKMFEKIWEFKFTPPGRGFWMMGTPVLEQKGAACLYNCAAVSTSDIKKDLADPFAWAADMLMLGVGCIAKDTWVQTDKGPRKIQDCVNQPLNLVLNGNIYSALNGFWSTGIKPVVKITTTDGNSIRLTKDHKVLKVKLTKTTNNKVKQITEWVEAGKLSPKDKIKISDNTNTDWEGKGSYEEGYLVGLVLGDGWFNHHNVVATVFDKDLGHEGIMSEALTCITQVSRRSICKDWRTIKGKESKHLTVGNWVLNYLDKTPKKIKDIVEETSSFFHKGFIKGMFDTDGTVSKSKKGYSLSLCQVNKDTLIRTQRMLLRLGIQSSINKKRIASKTTIQSKNCNQKECWILSITGQDIVTFSKRVGFGHTNKNIKLENIINSFQKKPYNKRYSSTVKSIEDDGEAETYDVTVPGVSSFESNGIITHNCGFDTKGAGTMKIVKPTGASITYAIPDSREGWVESIRLLIDSYSGNPKACPIVFDYTLIRASGEPIKGFGGTASGPAPLKEGHDNITKLLDSADGKDITSVHIVDIMNFIGKFIVAGNIRRSAELSLGELWDKNYLEMKDYRKYPIELNDRRWMSNNSVYANKDSNFSNIIENICLNGEPGVVFLENIQKYGRIKDGENKQYQSNWDSATLVNPCAEICLEHKELCNLVEIYPAHHDSQEEFFETLKFAYLYAKTVGLLPTHDKNVNAVIMRNRRLGISQTGIQQAIKKFGHSAYYTKYCDEAYEKLKEYDRSFSRWLGIPTSIRLTTVKPSGSVSLLAGSTPGIHYTHAEFYLRTIRLAANSSLLSGLRNSNYRIEFAATDKEKLYSCLTEKEKEYLDSMLFINSRITDISLESFDKFRKLGGTMVVYFPIKEKNFTKSKYDVTIWEQLLHVREMQTVWADNSVSVTITLQENDKKDLESALQFFSPYVKTLSFLPLSNHGYEQAPYITCTEQEYLEYKNSLLPLDLSEGREVIKGEKYCTTDRCEV